MHMAELIRLHEVRNSWKSSADPVSNRTIIKYYHHPKNPFKLQQDVCNTIKSVVDVNIKILSHYDA